MALAEHPSLVHKVQVLFPYLDSVKSKFEGLVGHMLNWVTAISKLNPMAAMVIYGFCMGVGFIVFIVTALLDLAAGTHALEAFLHVMEGLNKHVLPTLQLLNGLIALLLGFSMLLGQVNININVNSNRSRINPYAMTSPLSLRSKMIRSLPKSKYGCLRRRSDCVNRNDSLSSSCAICLGCVEEEDEVRILPNCRHYFHISCIDRWLIQCTVNSSSCPLCRASVIGLHSSQAE